MNTVEKYYNGKKRKETLRSILEREKRKGLNSGSLCMFFHFPVPCLATPALSASSSSAVHFCFGFPISLSLQPVNQTSSVSVRAGEAPLSFCFIHLSWEILVSNGMSFERILTRGRFDVPNSRLPIKSLMIGTAFPEPPPNVFAPRGSL